MATGQSRTETGRSDAVTPHRRAAAKDDRSTDVLYPQWLKRGGGGGRKSLFSFVVRSSVPFELNPKMPGGRLNFEHRRVKSVDIRNLYGQNFKIIFNINIYYDNS